MVRILNPVAEFKREQEHSKAGKMDFKIGDISCYSKVIVADENREVKAGKPISIKIKEIEIFANHMAVISAYASNKYGHPIAVGGNAHLPLSMDKKVNRASFTVVLNGKIEEGDLLGFLSLIPVEF